MLSSVLKKLDKAVSDESHIPHLVALYPNLKPQQIERAVGGKDSPFFYEYLTRLLHESGGKEMARMDADIVAVSFWSILAIYIQRIFGDNVTDSQLFRKLFLFTSLFRLPNFIIDLVHIVY